MLAMFLNDEIINKIKSIKTSILENKETIINMFTSYLEEKVDFKKIIIENVELFFIGIKGDYLLLAKKVR